MLSNSGSPSVVPGPAGPASFGNYLEMYILGPLQELTETKPGREGCSRSVLLKHGPSRWFWCPPHLKTTVLTTAPELYIWGSFPFLWETDNLVIKEKERELPVVKFGTHPGDISPDLLYLGWQAWVNSERAPRAHRPPLWTERKPFFPQKILGDRWGGRSIL